MHFLYNLINFIPLQVIVLPEQTVPEGFDNVVTIDGDLVVDINGNYLIAPTVV